MREAQGPCSSGGTSTCGCSPRGTPPRGGSGLCGSSGGSTGPARQRRRTGGPRGQGIDWTPSCSTRHWPRGRCVSARTWRRDGPLCRWGLIMAPWSSTSRWRWPAKRGSQGWPTRTPKAGCMPYARTPRGFVRQRRATAEGLRGSDAAGVALVGPGHCHHGHVGGASGLRPALRLPR